MPGSDDLAVSILPFGPQDVTDAYVGWLNDPEVMDQTEANTGRHTLASTRDYIAAANGDPNARIFRIMAAGEGHVGNIRISEITRQHQRADIALIIGRKDLWGRGIAPQAIACAVDEGFRKLGLHKLTAGMYHTNTGSIRAFLKAGFREEGRLPEHYIHNGSYVDRVALGLLRADWERVAD
tara:strand:+ start:7519 stop:8061 length:543 start_codon:yes stop_codon:yes gene_type:complete